MQSNVNPFYPAELKESTVRRYLTGSFSYQQLGAEIGASGKTVGNWVKAYKEMGSFKKHMSKRATDQRSAAEKFRLLMLVKSQPEAERGAVLRREGVRDGDLERWEKEALDGLGAQQPAASQAQLKKLEREKTKSEKRLREAEALLELQKKVQALWVAEDDDTPQS